MQNLVNADNRKTWIDLACRNHHAQFYDSERTLGETVAEFLEPGVKTGQPLIVIVTQPHREAISRVMMSHGFDVEGLVTGGQLRWLDADTTLSLFMTGTMPDADLFKNYVVKILEETRAGREHLTIRAFGEMVDVLCRKGNHEGAIRLEELWNEVGRTHGFSLMCAYAMGNFYQEAHWRHYQKICLQHGHVALATGGQS